MSEKSETTVKPKNEKVAKKKNEKRPRVALLLLVSLFMGFLGGRLGSNGVTGKVSTQTQKEIITTEGQVVSDVAKTVGESVVSVQVTGEVTQSNFFGYAQTVPQQSAGTGVIISEDGVIITNRHVVPTGSSNVSVTLSDGTELTDVEIIGRTNDTDTLDIAFLKIKDKKGKTLKAAKIGDSAKMQVGEKVIAIGNALGRFQNTVTTGIISGYGRDISAESDAASGSESLTNLFQTDAAINPGNSGGPLVNLSGEVIGINTAVAGGQNIGFAIPINDAQGLIKSVLTTGKLQRPYLGVRYVLLTDDYAYLYNLSVKRGAYLAPAQNGLVAVIADSPAAKAGLKEKDIITKIDGVSIDEKNSLISLVGKHSVGDVITLTVIRDGKEQAIKVTLDSAPTTK